MLVQIARHTTATDLTYGVVSRISPADNQHEGDKHRHGCHVRPIRRRFKGPNGQEDMPYLLTPGPLTTSRAVKFAMLADWGSWDRNSNSSWPRPAAAC